MCVVLYSHVYFITYICDCITGHVLPLCVVTFIHAWPSILQIICYHCVRFCTCTHTYRSMWLSTLQVMCYHYVWFLYVRHGNCLPWVVGWVGWGALHPVAPCSTEVTACVIVYITCGALHESSTLPFVWLSYTHSPYSMRHAHLPRTSFVMFCPFVNALYERTSPRQIPGYI